MKDCAFDKSNGECSALEVKNCHNCQFFKTKEQLREGRVRATSLLQRDEVNFDDYVRLKNKYHKKERNYDD